ncbi:MAG: peptidoglycan DD-metalloendopeptidase family protein [Desulfuromonadales bacterium]|nr:peptidoglycan DD-metalloendopeptidase family protein [Desulfuromonadales bacterium]
MKRWLATCLMAAFLLIGSAAIRQAAWADQDGDLVASQEKLAEIERQIEAGLRDLRDKQARSSSLADDLARLDDETRRLAAAVRRSGRELKKLDGQVVQVRKERETLQASLQTTGEKVRRRLTVLYKSGEIGLARVLLGATVTPYEMAENHAFLARLVRYDRQLIEDYRGQAQRLEERLVQLQQLREKQARLNERRNRQQEALGKAGKTKRKLLVVIRKDEALLSGYLDELRAKAARLGELVKKLETDLVQSYTEFATSFSQQKGRLAWPVSGKLRVGFGTTRSAELGTLLESNGLEIVAEVGSPVQAVWSGKVLYASPFRGYGKLMIIDHGDKYYSLYAQVARFAKQAGEQVSPGETVAYSGFEGRDYLYFEVRQSGKPLDPLPWLKRR